MPRTFTTRPYSKVVRDMWGDDRFGNLTPVKPSGQALWVYLLTGPHCNVIPGLFVNMGFGTLADRLDWSVADVKRHWKEIEDQKMAVADWKAGVIFLPNGFRHNEPANPNVVKSWRNVPLPQCELVRRALTRLREQLWPMEVERVRKLKKDGRDPKKSLGWIQAFDIVFAKGFPEAIIAGFPEDIPEELTQGILEEFGEGFPEPMGSTGSGTVPVTEDHSPLTPRHAGGISLRKPSADERKWAEAVRQNARGCPHTDGKCQSMHECVGRLVYLKRHNERAGMLEEARA